MVEFLEVPECKFGDPYCPCQDGDACHYVALPAMDGMPATKAMTPYQRLPYPAGEISPRAARYSTDFRYELARFNAERRALLGGIPPDPSVDRMPLPRSGVGGDVEDENA